MSAGHRLRWLMACAGCWALASAAELVGQWRLLSPPFSSFFGQPVVILVVSLYIGCGLALAMFMLIVPRSDARWILLLSPPAFLGTAGLLFPQGGLMGPWGALLGTGILLATVFTGRAVRHRVPSLLLGLPMVLLLVPAALSSWMRPAAQESRMGDHAATNVIVVTLDTLRPDHLGLAGYGRPTSPGLDSLAVAGMVFSTAYAPTPSTSPSHASIFTGLSPDDHGVCRNGWPLPDGIPTLAEALRTAGYETGAVVSVAHLAGCFGWSRGFSSFYDQGRLDRLFPYSGVRLLRLILRVAPLSFSCRAHASMDRAIAWLGGAREPFFLWLHLWDPHDPYAPPPPYDTMFTGPVSAPPGSGYDDGQVATWVNGYDGEIRYVDDQLSRLWQHLRDRGIDSRTLVVVASDHGESLGERSYVGHSVLLYEEQVRALFLIAGPGISPGENTTPVSLVDIMPTVMASLAVPAAGPMEGRALLSGSPQKARAIRFEADMWGFAGRGLRMGRWKLAFYDRVNPSHRGFAPSCGPQAFLAGLKLYDVAADPGETVNLAWEVPEQVALLTGLLGEGKPESRSGALSPGVERALRSLGYLE
ncbi:sulfatase [Candidatus Fermentibacteria bacterium]|nr:sulfatase [Candidatus Fermentibacteria bacterium]